MTRMSDLIAQFRKPEGELGRVAAEIMATRSSNLSRNQRTVELLSLQPHHHVLEIGFGPGVALTEIARIVERGRAVGVDHSDLMCQLARQRLDEAEVSDRVELHAIDVCDLGARIPGPFDRIMVVNVWQFWQDQTAVLRALRARLSPGGRLVITHQPRDADATAADSDDAASTLLRQLEDAGFVELSVETIPLDPVPAAAVVAALESIPEDG